MKDQFDVTGYDSTIGYVARAFRPAAEDAAVVALLRQMGAVVIAKTNLPQSIMVSRYAPTGASQAGRPVRA